MECNCQGSKTELDFSLLEPSFKDYKENDGCLITILQKAQELYGYLHPDVLTHISVRTGLKPANIIGVVTFYTQFRTKPIGKNLILVCQGTACHVNGSSIIEHAIQDHLKVDEGEMTADGLFTYHNVACIGCCSLAPAVMIGDKTYGKLSGFTVDKILAGIEEESK